MKIVEPSYSYDPPLFSLGLDAEMPVLLLQRGQVLLLGLHDHQHLPLLVGEHGVLLLEAPHQHAGALHLLGQTELAAAHRVELGLEVLDVEVLVGFRGRHNTLK